MGFGGEGLAGEAAGGVVAGDLGDGFIPELLEDGGMAAASPAGGDHLFDEFEFEVTGGLEAMEEVIDDGVIGLAVFGEDEVGFGAGAMDEVGALAALLAGFGDGAAGAGAVFARGLGGFLGEGAAAAALARGGWVGGFGWLDLYGGFERGLGLGVWILRHADRPPAGVFQVDASAQPRRG